MPNILSRFIGTLVIGFTSICTLVIILGTNSEMTPISLAHSPAAPNAPGQCFTTTWTFLTQTVTSTRFRIHFTLDGVNFPTHALQTLTQATLLSADLETAYDAYVSYGFEAPDLNSDGFIETYIYGSGAWGRAAPSWDCIVISPGRVRTSAGNIRLGTPHHELFHRVQFEYDAGETSWMGEGTAKMMEDQVFADTDTDPNSAFLNEVGNYLANPDLAKLDKDDNIIGGGLLQASYKAALFWKYLSEQYGDSPTTEPGYRSNALVELYEAAQTADSTGAVEEALDNLGFGNLTFGDVFNDFIAANFLKDYPGQIAHHYLDDNATPYAAVTPISGTVLLNGNSSISRTNQGLFAWGADYHQATLADSCQTVQVWGRHIDGAQIYWHVAVIDDSDEVEHLDSVSTTPGQTIVYAYSNAAADLDKLMVIAGADAQEASYDIEVKCVTPTLNIITPRTTNLAYAGDPADPDKINVVVEVTAGGTSLQGLDGDAFVVTIGGQPATVLVSVYVQNQYWLTVLPPTQPAPNLYDLAVSFGAASDTELLSVLYQPRPSTDQVLVLDSSGSMADENKLDAAKNAASMNLNIARDNLDQFGVISFATTSKVLFPLNDANSGSHLIGILALSAMTPGGATCIGCGIEDAQDELDSRGVITHFPNIVLLSDGMENRAPFWDDVKSSVLNAETVVDTIYLGPPDETLSGTAESLMQSIAAETGGTYNRVFLESEAGAHQIDAPGAIAAPATHKIQPASAMADVYLRLHERVSGFQRMQDELGLLVMIGQQITYTLNMETGLDQALLVLNVDKPNTTQFVLRRPNGTTVNPGDPDVIVVYQRPTHFVYRFNKPMAGTWRARITNIVNDEVQHLLVLQGDSDLLIETHREPFGATLSPTVTQGVQGMPIRIIANLTAQTPITGAHVTARVQGPVAGVSTTLRLFDDGRHNDGQASDGIYANLAHRTAVPGSYCFNVTALIPTTGGGNTERSDRTCLYVEPGTDTDGDQLPDQWELLYRFNPNSATDASRDPDADGLTNSQEFFVGTNPRSDDTDNGGENDQSELSQGRNPFEPADDRIKAPSGLVVKPKNGSNTILFARVPGATQYVLLRATNFQGPFTVVSNSLAPTGIYTDAGLANNTPYIYRLAAIDGSGNRSRFTSKAGAVPRTETEPPEGEVVINDDAPQTNRRQVSLSLAASPDTVKMKISNSPNFDKTLWEPFAPTKNWTLPSTPGYAAVHVLFQDAAGNVSEETASDGIRLELLRLYLPLIVR
ncbi:hypothetical protein TFLX_00707 [Thermoflexales bacterium]|nr:hypothetical protein TFLX_00707 [Thermoflexales bacterium]